MTLTTPATNGKRTVKGSSSTTSDQKNPGSRSESGRKQPAQPSRAQAGNRRAAGGNHGFFNRVSGFFKSLFAGRETTEIDEETNDPDFRPLLQGKIDSEEYIEKRQEWVNVKLGMTPGETYDPMIRVRAVDTMEREESELRAQAKKGAISPAISGTTWTNLGPYPIPNGQTSGRVDPVSGRTVAIAVHPTNPDIVYVGTAQGGVYRSLNGGTTWTQLFNNAQSQVIGALALAPSNPEILYVGTGEAGQCGSGCYAGIGVYRIDNASTTAI